MSPLRLMWITDGRGDAGRIGRIARAAIDGGVRSVQVREAGLPAAGLARLCRQLRPLLDAVGGWLLVNDRADVAAAAGADGVHLGQRSLAVGEVRALWPRAVVGVSCHDPEELAAARAAGADYASLSPVLPTDCKPGAEALGPERARAWTAAAGLPVVWLGGVTPASLPALAPITADGLAVRGALAAGDPRETAAVLAAAEVAAWTP